MVFQQFEQKTGLSFTDFYNKNREKLVWFLMTRNYNKEEAEDIADESIERALDKIDLFNPEKSSFTTWLFTIAKNRLTQEFKTKDKFSPIEDSGINTLEYEESIEAKKQRVNKSKVDSVKNAIKKLDEKFSTIIVAREIDGLAYYDLSLYFGINMSTVKNRIRQARIKIKELIKEEFEQIEKTEEENEYFHY